MSASATMNRSANELIYAFQANDITSLSMRNAIDEWHRLYYQSAPTEQEDPCQQIPYTIVRKLTKTAFSEYKASGQNDFVQGVLDALGRKRNEAMQKALIGGEVKLKPIPTKSGFTFGVVIRPNVLVFGKDPDGNMTDIGTWEITAVGAYYYTLLERRTVDQGGYLTIKNALYRSATEGHLGQRISLQELPQYAALPDMYTFPQPIGSVGMATLRTPVANCVDGSADSVSVYAAAVGLIHNINRNEAQLNLEFEQGKSRLIVSGDLLKRDKNGRRGLVDSVFVGLDEDAETVGITAFAPELREKSFLARKQDYLRSAESIIGLKRGLLSEVEAADRTAKEITSSEGDYNLTIIEFQQAWEDACREAVKLCGVLGQMYRVPAAYEVRDEDITIDWGNGILYDEEATWQDMKDQVARGLLKPEIAVGWRYGMPYDTPEDLRKIREKYMPEVENLMGGE